MTLFELLPRFLCLWTTLSFFCGVAAERSGSHAQEFFKVEHFGVLLVHAAAPGAVLRRRVGAVLRKRVVPDRRAEDITREVSDVHRSCNGVDVTWSCDNGHSPAWFVGRLVEVIIEELTNAFAFDPLRRLLCEVVEIRNLL